MRALPIAVLPLALAAGLLLGAWLVSPPGTLPLVGVLAGLYLLMTSPG